MIGEQPVLSIEECLNKTEDTLKRFKNALEILDNEGVDLHDAQVVSDIGYTLEANVSVLKSLLK